LFPESHGNGGDESDRRSGDGESDLRQNGLEPRNIKTPRERFLEGLEKAEKEVAGANFDPCEEEFCNDDGAFGNDDDGGDFVNDDDGGDFEYPASISMPTPTPTKTAHSFVMPTSAKATAVIEAAPVIELTKPTPAKKRTYVNGSLPVSVESAPLSVESAGGGANLTGAKRPYVKRNHEGEAARKLFKKKYDASEARLAAKAKKSCQPKGEEAIGAGVKII
jgi:hypothetical protein